MATVNLYVSDELKARMSQHSINWSKVASTAIEAAIDLEDRKEVSMEAASIERLRQSRDKSDEHRRAEGVSFGKNWALNVAEYEDLERVSALADSADELNDAPYSLAQAMLDEERADSRDCSELFEQVFGRESISAALAIGFIEGAREVFDEV